MGSARSRCDVASGAVSYRFQKGAAIGRAAFLRYGYQSHGGTTVSCEHDLIARFRATNEVR